MSQTSTERHEAMMEFINCFPITAHTTSSTSSNLNTSVSSMTSTGSYGNIGNSGVITNLLDLNDGIVLFQAMSIM